MKIAFTKNPLRLVLGAILAIIGILSLLGINFPFAGTIFTVVGIIVGILLIFKNRFLN